MTDKTAAAEIAEPSRHAQRLERLPAIYKTNQERMCCELGLGLEEPLLVFRRYGYDKDQALALLHDAGFGRLLDRISKEVREQGMGFRAKARAMAEDLLPEAYAIATDDQAAASVRAELIQWFAKVGDLEPMPKKPGEGAPGGGGFSLQIVFAGEKAPSRVVEHEPLTIEG